MTDEQSQTANAVPAREPRGVQTPPFSAFRTHFSSQPMISIIGLPVDKTMISIIGLPVDKTTISITGLLRTGPNKFGIPQETEG